MQWEISEENQRPKDSGEIDQYRWRTRLGLDLPKLGNIDAELRIDNNNQLQLSIKTGKDESRKNLQNAVALLDQSLQAAGLKLSSFNVAKVDENPN